eukprot:SAG31_NODE_12110_length_967_cov_1.881336_1_plen_130_part_00
MAGLHPAYEVSKANAQIKLDAAAVLRIGAAEGSLETPHGPLHWGWTLKVADRSLRVELSIPHGFLTGQLEMPLLDYQSVLSESGSVVWSRGPTANNPRTVTVLGVQAVEAKSNRLHVHLQPGDYIFLVY